MVLTKNRDSGCTSISRSSTERYRNANTHLNGLENAAQVYSKSDVCKARPHPQVSYDRDRKFAPSARSHVQTANINIARISPIHSGDTVEKPLAAVTPFQSIDRSGDWPMNSVTVRFNTPSTSEGAIPNAMQNSAGSAMEVFMMAPTSCARLPASLRGSARKVMPNARTKSAPP